MSQDPRIELGRVLMQALELDDDAQKVYVEDLRHKNPELATELESMLNVGGMETDFLADSAAEEVGMPEDWWQDETSQNTDLSTGSSRQIGPYRLLRLLGRGGMGEVYLAEQKEPLERTVALKLIRGTFRDEDAKTRFEAEKQMLQKLDHPNVGRILDAGTREDGSPFFALEVISGERVDQYCDQQGLNIRQRLELMLAVCRGVEHAHRKRIIHRDIKPSNILVCEIDGEAVPKIIDFGIAESMDRPKQTATSSLAYGTPAYMSPEALLGTADVDTRTDVYSLGALLYELVVGCRPFDAETFNELVDQVPNQDPPTPSTRLSRGVDRKTALRIAEQRQSTRLDLMRTLRGDLSWILLKAIAKNAEQRYDSVSALADDLKRHLQNLPIAARPSSSGYRIRKWLTRHRWPAALMTLISVAVLGLLIQEVSSRERTERLTRAGQELTRQIERVEWRLRVASLLPRQDLTSELESIRQGMGDLMSKLPELYAGNRGMAQYAIGRGALSLGDLEIARTHLETAWEEGYRTPETALALGTTLGRLYERQLDAVSRVADRTTREALRLEAETELRGPALEMLTKADTELALPELLLARIAFYHGELDNALEQSRAASQRGPIFFEARFLEAQILQRKSQEGGVEKSEAMDLLGKAQVAAEQGLEIARSSLEGHLRLCRIHGGRVNLLARYGLEGLDAAVETSIAACTAAKKVMPSSPEADFDAALTFLGLAEVQVWDRHEDPSETLAKLASILTRVQDSKMLSTVDRAETETLFGQSEKLRFTYQINHGHDALPTLDRSIHRFRNALRLRGGNHHVHRELAHSLLERGHQAMRRGENPEIDFEQALTHARNAVDLAPTSSPSIAYFAHVQIRRAEYQIKVGQDPEIALNDADQALERAQELDQGRVSVLSAITVAIHLRGLWEKKSGKDPGPTFLQAVEAAKTVLDLFPDSAYSFLMGGGTFSELARLELLAGRDPTDYATQSKEWHRLGLEKVPGAAGAYITLAEVALTEAEHARSLGVSPVATIEEAQAHARQALEINPERHDALLQLGEAERILAEHTSRQSSQANIHFSQAKRFLEQAREGDPSDVKSLIALARWVWRKSLAGQSVSVDELNQGLAATREAQTLDTSAMEALALEGALLSLTEEDRAQSRRMIQEAVARNPNLAKDWHDLAAAN